MRLASMLIGLYLLGGGCASTEDNALLGSVDLGDNFVAPDLQLDEDFFFCRIQPEVLTEHSCAGGSSEDSGGCHETRSALRLLDSDETTRCDDGAVAGPVPDAFQRNLEAIRFSVQSDPLDSPLYLRPLNRASHPRKIFDEDDPAADLILEWISAGAR